MPCQQNEKIKRLSVQTSFQDGSTTASSVVPQGERKAEVIYVHFSIYSGSLQRGQIQNKCVSFLFTILKHDSIAQ